MAIFFWLSNPFIHQPGGQLKPDYESLLPTADHSISGSPLWVGRFPGLLFGTGCIPIHLPRTVDAKILLLPFFLFLLILTALGFGLWLTALNVRYRDVKQLLPFLVQIWMYLTPVIYSASLIPERFQWLLAINPMTGVVGGFRWSLLGNQMEQTVTISPVLLLSTGIVFLVLMTGAIYFRHTERTFADVI